MTTLSPASTRRLFSFNFLVSLIIYLKISNVAPFRRTRISEQKRICANDIFFIWPFLLGNQSHTLSAWQKKSFDISIWKSYTWSLLAAAVVVDELNTFVYLSENWLWSESAKQIFCHKTIDETTLPVPAPLLNLLFDNNCGTRQIYFRDPTGISDVEIRRQGHNLTRQRTQLSHMFGYDEPEVDPMLIFASIDQIMRDNFPDQIHSLSFLSNSSKVDLMFHNILLSPSVIRSLSTGSFWIRCGSIGVSVK